MNITSWGFAISVMFKALYLETARFFSILWECGFTLSLPVFLTYLLLVSLGRCKVQQSLKTNVCGLDPVQGHSSSFSYPSLLRSDWLLSDVVKNLEFSVCPFFLPNRRHPPYSALSMAHLFTARRSISPRGSGGGCSGEVFGCSCSSVAGGFIGEANDPVLILNATLWLPASGYAVIIYQTEFNDCWSEHI